jgi:hypothetical protein
MRFGTAISILTSNEAMSDGKALFHSDHNILYSGAIGAKGDTTLSVSRLAMVYLAFLIIFSQKREYL